MSLDGTPPLRVVFRLNVDINKAIWRNGPQMQFMPKDLHISHILIYAVLPKYCHYCNLCTVPSICKSEQASKAAEELMKSSKFKATSEIIKLTTVTSREAEEESFPARWVSLQTRQQPHHQLRELFHIEKKGREGDISLLT